METSTQDRNGAPAFARGFAWVSPRLRTAMLGVAAVAVAVVSQGSSSFVAEGGEYAVSGILPGEQVYPQISIGTTGGYVVWQDNITDGDGYGISARKLDGTLSGALGVFRVNQTGVADQERPAVTRLNHGGAAFFWQGGKQGFQRIYGRFLGADGLWVTGDFQVSAAPNAHQREISATTLTNGNVVVSWSSMNQVSPTSLRDVYFQILSPAGVKIGPETRVNQSFTAFNQRSSAVVALPDGRFAVAWITEQQTGENRVDVQAQFYSNSGVAMGAEFRVNSSSNLCANPALAPNANGGLLVAWMQRDLGNPVDSWDVQVRPVSALGILGSERRINTWTTGDQLAPKVASVANEYLVTWTSMAQDSSRDGVYGQFLAGDGSLAGAEFRINTTVVGDQRHHVVASDRASRFLVSWTGYVGGTESFDLFAQRFVSTSQPLAAPGAPMVNVLSSNSLSVSWPPVAGLNVTGYEVYADGSATATVTVTNNYWNHMGLAPASTHSYRLAYVVADGRKSPLSGAATNTTYAAGATWGGVPQEWMAGYFGTDIFSWPSPHFDSDADGVSNRDEFLQGTNPTDATSVLKQRLQATPQGLFLRWNTEAGLMYQVWSSPAPGAGWTRLGTPRFAAGNMDSLYVGGHPAGFYRIERLR